MKVQASLLCLAIASALASSAHAAAADPTPEEAAAARRAAVVARANALIGSNPAAIHRAADDTFDVRDVITDANGTEHVRYQRSFDGLPVIGGDFVVHSRDAKLAGFSQTLGSAFRPELLSKLGSDEAIVVAGNEFGSHFIGAPTSRTVIYARSASPVLAHEVVFNGVKADQTPTEMHYFVDANSGKILDKWDGINTAKPGPGGGGTTTCTAATGTGNSLTEGNVVLNTSKCGATYQLVDTTRGGGATHTMAMLTAGMGTVVTDADNVWGTGLVNNAQTVAADAHYGVATTWDYYKTVHGRMGIANDGEGAISRVHYGRNYQNAFWSDGCFCMTFGDGDNGATILPLIALDVAGHEMSHGVTSRSAGLAYSGDAGGLNESTSDIFGTMVEYFANNSNDPGDYVIGEKLYKNNADMSKAIRWMFKPSLDGYSYDCYESAVSGDDPHFSSGVGNHFFYLLAEGAVVPTGFGANTWANLTPAALVCNGNTAITGIGREAASKIWYRALTVYMTSGTTYPQARAATISAVADLYPGDTAKANAVKAAWSAVSVN